MKVFRLNDCDWYMAKTIEEAIQAYVNDTDGQIIDIINNPEELTEEDLNNTVFTCDDGEKISFRQRLNEHIDTGDTKAQLFASTEQ